MMMLAALILWSTALPALIAALVLLNTGLIEWLNRENDIPFGLPEWARLGLLIPLLAAVGTGLVAWQNGGQFVDALLVGLFGVGPGIVLVLLGKLSAWFRSRRDATSAQLFGTSVPPVGRFARRYPRATVGLGSTSVDRDDHQQVTVLPQRLFRVDRLVIPPSVAECFSVLNITVAETSVFVSSDAIPGTAFLPGSESHEVRMTCQVGQRIVVTVRNTGLAPKAVFTGYLEGVTVR